MGTGLCGGGSPLGNKDDSPVSGIPIPATPVPLLAAWRPPFFRRSCLSARSTSSSMSSSNCCKVFEMPEAIWAWAWKSPLPLGPCHATRLCKPRSVGSPSLWSMTLSSSIAAWRSLSESSKKAAATRNSRKVSGKWAQGLRGSKATSAVAKRRKSCLHTSPAKMTSVVLCGQRSHRRRRHGSDAAGDSLPLKQVTTDSTSW
mmetsp:Transcript_116202/g.248566  ORF Transcript_116202/g.248566 Transcript_116202/m.248566 type:complete len:201 (+) Transcript_116202:511-1113(+)